MRHRMRECVLKSSLLNLFLISLSLCNCHINALSLNT